MSASEHQARIGALEQNPGLLPQIEALDWESISGEILRHGDPNAQTEAKLLAPNWPDPEPLGGELPAVQALDPALLPDSLRPLVEDTAERMQVPMDYPAVVAVLCLAGVTNRRAAIQPNAADTSWNVVPNLWGGIIAPPGLMKSPVISAVTQPLTRIESLWRTDHDSAMSDYRQQQEEAELRQAAWREKYKAAQKSGKDAPIRPDDSIAEPLCARLITQDATSEKLHEIMRDNPSGVLVIRDELSGWLATLDKPGRGVSAASFCRLGMEILDTRWIASDGAASMWRPVACLCLAGYSRRDCGAIWPMLYMMAR
jgi:putative DNA primase/helicase